MRYLSYNPLAAPVIVARTIKRIQILCLKLIPSFLPEKDSIPTKPAPEGTRALMARLGVEADGSVLYVGDSNVDVETAHNAGLPCCGVLWGFRTREELTEAGAEYLAEDTQGLEKVVLG